MTENPLTVFIASFLLSFSAGLAAYLRSNALFTWRAAVVAGANSGFLGLGVSLLWYIRFKDDLYALVGICVVLGLGGTTVLEYLLDVFRKGGFFLPTPGRKSRDDQVSGGPEQ